MRLNHITLAASDVAASAAFYRRLGLEQIVAAYPDYARLVSPEGDTTLSLSRAGAGETGEAGATGAATEHNRASIHFEVGDVDATVAALKARGFEFADEPVDQPYLWREAVLLDPDGRHIFIYNAGVNRLDPPWRLPRAETGDA